MNLMTEKSSFFCASDRAGRRGWVVIYLSPRVSETLDIYPRDRRVGVDRTKMYITVFTVMFKKKVCLKVFRTSNLL